MVPEPDIFPYIYVLNGMHIFALADTVLGQTERFAATIVVASHLVPMHLR